MRTEADGWLRFSQCSLWRAHVRTMRAWKIILRSQPRTVRTENRRFSVEILWLSDENGRWSSSQLKVLKCLSVCDGTIRSFTRTIFFNIMFFCITCTKSIFQSEVFSVKTTNRFTILPLCAFDNVPIFVSVPVLSQERRYSTATAPEQHVHEDH